jgi:hypothetical protein
MISDRTKIGSVADHVGVAAGFGRHRYVIMLWVLCCR